MSIVFIRAVIIYITVIISLRIMGKRQIGELTPHELVITILVSQVAIIPLQDNGMPLANMVVPILIFVSLEILVSAISMKSLTFRNLVQGKPIFVIRNGKLDEKQMRRLRLTIDDLTDAVREKGFFDLSSVQDAVIETNGTVSVLQKAEESPVTSSFPFRLTKISLPCLRLRTENPRPNISAKTKSSSAKSNCLLKRAAVKCTK